MAAKYIDTVTAPNGDAISGATVEMFTSGGASVTLYADADLTQAIGKQAATNDNGLVEVYVPDGTYTVRQSFRGIHVDLPNTELYDISSIIALAGGTISAGDGITIDGLGEISLAQIPTDTFLGNVSGVPASPAPVGIGDLRVMLDLGTAAPENIGTSGHVVPLLDAANIWGAEQTLPWSQAGTGAVARIIRDKLRERISPADFGVTADGVDSTAAFQLLVNHVNSLPYGAEIALPAGVIRLTTTAFTFTKPVIFAGRGVVQSQIHLYSNARISCDYTRGVLVGAAEMNPSCVFRDVALLTDGIHTSSPLLINYSPHADVSLTPTVTIENVLVAGRNPTSGFTYGISLADVPWPKLTNVTLIGDYGNGVGFTSGTGIVYTGGDGSASFTRVRGYSLTEFIYCSGSMEGLTFDDCECVSVQHGITYADTTAGLQPVCVIRGTHLNCEEYCISLTGIDLFHIGDGTSLFANNAKGTATGWTGIYVNATNATGTANSVVTSGRISGCTFNGDGGFAPLKYGIFVDGKAISIEDYLITGNRFQGLNVGVQLAAPTNGVMVANSNMFRNVVTQFGDLGAGNYREPKTFSVSGVGTTDASGRIAFTFGGAVVFTVSPVVTVSGGDSGAETYTVVFSTVSATGFTVQIAFNGVALGAGQTRRVSYVAVGY